MQEQTRTSNATYESRDRVVSDLLRLAGIDRHTRVGYDRARVLLQGHALSRVPGAVADALIGQHQLDPAIREPLRARIRDATLPGLADPVGAIKRDFVSTS